MLTKTEGETAVRLARRAMEECLRNKIKIMPDNLPSLFKEKRGVFVTLNKKKTIKELRGCIGRPYPILPLGEAIIVSAINAAREDPRFDPVEPGEIGDLVIEVTVLTLPR